jgi:hypothetical protein
VTDDSHALMAMAERPEATIDLSDVAGRINQVDP